MNLAHLPLLALLVAAPLPFPAPKLIAASDALKSDAGTIASVDAAKQELKMNAPAGQITFKVAEAQVAGPDGRPLGSPTHLRPGQRVRVYYVVDNGAVAREIDVQP